MLISLIGDPHIREKCPPGRKDVSYLDTCLEKLEFIFEQNEYNIILGDLFDKYTNSDYTFNRVYNLFNKYKGRVGTIIGNHDIFSRSMHESDMNRTTIKSLQNAGVLDIIIKAFSVDGCKFGVSFVDKSNYATIPRGGDVLLAHNYFGSGWESLCLSETLTKSELKELNYTNVVMGHDHTPYEDELCNDGRTTVYRLGSLMRCDIQQYNENRKINYLQYNTTKELEKVEVPCKLSKDIFVENAFKKHGVVKNETNFIKIGEALEKFNKQYSKENRNSIHKAMIHINAGKKHIDKTKVLHEENSLVFN